MSFDNFSSSLFSNFTPFSSSYNSNYNLPISNSNSGQRLLEIRKKNKKYTTVYEDTDSFIIDPTEVDEDFPPLSKGIVLKQRGWKKQSYKLADVALDYMKDNLHDISNIPPRWTKDLQKTEIEKNKKETSELDETIRKEKKRLLDVALKLKDANNKLDLEKEEFSRLEKEIASVKRKLNRFGKSVSGPMIVKTDSKIDYTQPEFIVTTTESSWVYNTCSCGSSSIHRPAYYSTINNLKIIEAYKNYQNGGLDTVTVITEDIGTHILNFSTMKYTTPNGYTTNSIGLYPGKTIQTPNPKYNGRHPIHETFQMRTYEDQFESSYSTVSLKPSTTEYKMVENNFLTDTCGSFPTLEKSGVRVLDVIKVINPESAKFYELTKETVKDKTEIMVYHGTRSADVDVVAKEGLDVRLGAGGYYGQAIYGSDSAFYSYNGYGHALPGKNGEGKLLYVKFLVGNVMSTPRHNGSLVKSPEGFDSVRNTSFGEEGIRTVYENSRVYISYIIHYATR